MTTVTHNSTTPSVSVTAASGNNPPQLVATLVPDEQRISFWPQHFGLIPQWVTLEPRVFGWMDRLCEDYCGGIWNLYTLNNGGAFMAPEPDDDDDETWVLFSAMNGTRSQLINSIDILRARRATGLMTRDNYRTVNNITLGKHQESKRCN
ncbi:TPA: restriction endonuclease [Escherichia coli]|nr:restriction endonuclease [Escherichia coli]